MERQHQLELSRQVDAGKKAIGKLRDEIGILEARDLKSVAHIHELEASVVQLHGDAEAAQRSARVLRDKLAESDRLLQIARMNLDTAEKQNQKYTSQVSMMDHYSYSALSPLPALAGLQL